MEMYTKQERIAYRARTHPQEAFVSIGHYLTKEWLEEAYHRTRKDGVVGVDGVTAQSYERNLDVNLERLSNLARSGKYKAPPVRRSYVPKPGKKEVRPIGIPSFEDKVLQRGVAMILEPIYEQAFLDCSYGFRPGRSAHKALENIWQNIRKLNGCWILDVDIRKFFDTLDHQHLREILDRRIRDGVVRRLIGKWLRAGVWESGALSYPDKGTPQGGCISPLLSNIYLHTVLDEWFESQIKPRLQGRAFLVRFADDFVIGFSHERDARRVMDVLPKRFSRFGLEVHPDKTRLVNFMPPRRHPGGESETFDFLGFTHYWGKSKRGYDTVKRKTAKDRMSRTLKAMKRYCDFNRHLKIPEQCKALNRKLIGHYAYFGITGNFPDINRVYQQTRRIWFKWLRRRTRGNKGMTWPRFAVLESTVFTLKQPRIMHSYM
jgi:group II intron reverse transcriptase/maturase